MLQKALSRFMLQAPILESMVILLLMVRQYLFLLDKSMVQWEDWSFHINDYASLLNINNNWSQKKIKSYYAYCS